MRLLHFQRICVLGEAADDQSNVFIINKSASFSRFPDDMIYFPALRQPQCDDVVYLVSYIQTHLHRTHPR